MKAHWPSAINWAYVAGFFDGEGSITVTSRPPHGTLLFVASVAQTQEEVLLQIQDFLKAHGIRSFLGEKRRVKHAAEARKKGWKKQRQIQIWSRVNLLRFSGVFGLTL